MTAENKNRTVPCLFVGVASLFVVFCAGLYFSTVSTVMKKASPDRQHIAKLVRTDGIDVNFWVTVDGRQVYSSPDFRPMHADFRERIDWDENGNTVVLEVGGKRIFGYQAVEQRNLSAAELLNVQFTPFTELGFEGELPSAASGR